jgi:four helix bundle protein
MTSLPSQPEPQPRPQPRPLYLSFKEMPVWQEAMAVAEQVFALTDKLPRKEDYGFTSQIRRAALSISANIAEAFGRNHTLDKVNFYFVARGSLTETQSHLEYGKRVGYLNPKSVEELSNRLSNIHADLNRLVASLRKSSR